MRPYHVATTYDPLTLPRIPYTEVAAYIAEHLHKFDPCPRTLLDLACGTGNLSLPLARLGYQVIGLDIAEEMLAIAQEKATAAGLDIPFFCQDMCAPYVGAPVDAAICFYGGLNFLNSSAALQQAFTHIYRALKPGGILIFDQFSAAKMRATFAGTQAADMSDFFVVTRSKCDDRGQVTHTVTFFLREPDGSYRREEEQHHIRIHPFDEITALLEATGFAHITIDAIFPRLNARSLQDTYLFSAQKP